MWKIFYFILKTKALVVMLLIRRVPRREWSVVIKVFQSIHIYVENKITGSKYPKVFISMLKTKSLDQSIPKYSYLCWKQNHWIQCGVRGNPTKDSCLLFYTCLFGSSHMSQNSLCNLKFVWCACSNDQKSHMHVYCISGECADHFFYVFKVGLNFVEDTYTPVSFAM